MNISERNGKFFILCHGMHIYQLDLETMQFGEQTKVFKSEDKIKGHGKILKKTCKDDGTYEVVFERPEFLMTPKMICVREDCPECKRAAEERGTPGYRTPAQTCFPLIGDSEAMEMHLRYRIQSGNLSASQAESKKKALAEIKAKLNGDKWAEERLATCLRHLSIDRQGQGVEI